ncbi:hypothetical protein M441DRAFT_73408 [Trichoderma asperellum CBS 433.97]|uniref:Secreted protein n=1 Tax=Trichoderma asperellum (strain ATCC 204424 / CBS 433.97 / NBRC 101777) TaxID=1042311 RepID=A0A2T3YVL4_TRIA4|nr:hypothetical protein M441DRAFT_73408 [Trichoderma asperellum CBS 433.97]PTB36611.1 hypothetical protein M441DRAFT_73408 [Trichoderma asperellum CBS 433.97]
MTISSISLPLILSFASLLQTLQTLAIQSSALLFFLNNKNSIVIVPSHPFLPLIITTLSPPARANPLQPRSLTWHCKHSAACSTWCNPSTHMCIQ